MLLMLIIQNGTIQRYTTICLRKNITTQKAHRFPALKFFNTSSSKSNFLSYLCSDKQDTEKCCSCHDKYHIKCGIDAFWNEFTGISLDKYISYFIKRRTENGIRKVCKPLLAPLQGHLFECFLIVTSYKDVEQFTTSSFNQLPYFSRKNGELSKSV